MNSNSRIVGGNDAVPGRYPYMVSIQSINSPAEIPREINFFDANYFYENEEFSSADIDRYFNGGNNLHFCGGSLISSRAVLTSGLCGEIANSVSFEVVVGCDDITNELNCTISAVQEVVIHPNFSLIDNNAFGDDIAILILAEDVSNPTIPLASPNVAIQSGEKVRHVGYGATLNLNSPPRTVLREIDLDAVENDVCINQLADVFDVVSNPLQTGNLDTVFCATGDGKSGCTTDIGGPAFYPCDTEGLEDIQLGVFSFSFNCGGDGIPIVFESVFTEAAFNFIQSVVQSFNLDDVQFIDSTDGFCPDFPIDQISPPTPFPTFIDTWSCDPAFFSAFDGCDCDCGLPDPDCELPGQRLFNCDPGEQCIQGNCLPPTASPTGFPTATPTGFPTIKPTTNPTAFPTINPTTTPKEAFLATLDGGDVGLGIGILFLFLIVFVLALRQKRQNKKSTIVEKEHEEKNLALVLPKGKGVELPTFGGHKLSAQDDTFSLSSGITELQKRRSGGVASEFTLQTVNTTLTDKDRANHMKVRSVISGHTKYSQVTDMMLELNDLAKLQGDARKKSFIHGVVSVLNKTLVENVEQVDDQLSEFDAEVEPDISLPFYLLRLIEGVNFWFEPTDTSNATIGIRSMLLALHLLRKMKDSLGFQTTALNIHKTLSVLVLLSAKFIEDKPFSNTYWAAIAGMEAAEISKLEDVFCFSVGFDFSIDQIELGKSLSPYASFTL